MLYFAWHMMRRRIAALLAVMCATLGGAAMATGIGVLAETGLRSHAPVERLALADVVVSASQTYHPDDDLPISLPERARVPAGLADRLARLPGVESASADLSFPAVVLGHGEVVPADAPGTNGHGWSSTALLADPHIDGSAPRGSREVALDERTAAAADVRPGDEVTVTASGRTAAYTVSAVVRTAGAGASGVYFPDSVVESVAAAPGRADLIAVRARAGDTEAVAAAVREAVREDGLTVTTGAARGDIESPATAAAGAMLPALAGSLAGVTLLVVGFIVGGALSVSIASQRRELALMRAVGATPRQIRRLAAGQAVIITLAACVPGIGLGYLLADQLRNLLVSVGMLPSGLPLTVGPLPAVAALLLLTGVVAVAAVCAAWRTSRMPATEAVAESRSEPRTPSALRTRAGAALIVVATGISVMPLLDRTQAGAAGTAVAGLGAAVGLALAGPALVGGVGRALAGRLSAKTPAPTWLAVENSHGYALRVAGAVSTLAITVVFTLTYTLTQTTVLAATGKDVRDATRAQLGLSAPALGGVPDDLPGALLETPGVESAAPVGETTVVWQYSMFGEPTTDSGSALVLTPDAAGVLDLDVRAGGLDRLTGDTVALSSETAASLDVETGDRVRLVLGDGGHVTAGVVATYGRGLGLGPMVLSRDLAAGHTTTGLAQRVLVRTDGSRAAHEHVAALAEARPGLVLDDAPGTPGGASGVQPELWINIAVIGVLLGYLLLGIANKLVATTTSRRTELATLQLIGATPRQVRVMMRREAALIAGMALGTGLLASVLPLVLLSAGFLGRPWPAGPGWLLPAIAAVVVGIAFAAVEVPTRRALRTPAVDALSRG